MTTPLVRPRGRKMIAGVCAGLAQRFGVSTGLVRIGFVLFGLFGVGEIAYIALWIMIPKER
ncbi:PspC domain-containing protein [Blastococcus sp. MG754426]|uniref:PspC domain-containing protein n=1 Tax=unclassified Blastococcus TaxID=2619396 RepID=UPI0021083E0F|nr:MULTISPECIES: PspC domain-containing protein [unclassified Blastococcus]MCF6507433.1 PspC domain-containing protein [Blastococcus sp. MG754426]MCF6512019.1 PspC domain-containing protein [Blastococcus sp. MG754427]MCF6734940.1 PspC domain-containing protein [Blastococcus sp. KM273129]